MNIYGLPEPLPITVFANGDMVALDEVAEPLFRSKMACVICGTPTGTATARPVGFLVQVPGHGQHAVCLQCVDISEG